MTVIELMGLPNCDSTRKARRDLELAGKTFSFRDLRANPLTPAEIVPYLGRLGPGLLNKSSTTWRALPETEKMQPPAELLARHPTLAKRPLLVQGSRISMGWSAATAAIWLQGD